MSQKLWTHVDRYLADLLVPSDSVLDAALEANAEAGLPPIDVTPIAVFIITLPSGRVI